MNCVHLVQAVKTHIILHSCKPTAVRKIFLLLIIFDWLAVEGNRSDCGGKSKHTFTVCLFFYCQVTLFTLRDNDCEQIAGVPACRAQFHSFTSLREADKMTGILYYCHINGG